VDRQAQLLGALKRGVVLRPDQIQSQLKIYPPVMSLLIREAGPLVARFGRGVNTRYALPREVAGLGRAVPVYRADDRGQTARTGHLNFLAGGGYYFEPETGDGQTFAELPFYVGDVCARGYIGDGFAARFPELKLPARLGDWTDDHHLIALARRGEDCVGSMILGEESLSRFRAGPRVWARSDYAQLARGALADQPAALIGGDHPKFAAYSEGRHVIVKFAGGDGAAANRRRDLLLCEHLALEVLWQAGLSVSKSAWFDLDGTRYLEIERFDRVGAKGRRGVLSLHALSAHYLGGAVENWSRAGRRIQDEPTLSMAPAHADRMIWLDTFGDLIGNTDRGLDNYSFFAERAAKTTLVSTPVYDTGPTVLAPAGDNTFAPQPPAAANRHLWSEVAPHALKYWSRLRDADGLSAATRKLAATCRDTLSKLVEKV
jgi:hypothetical protein